MSIIKRFGKLKAIRLKLFFVKATMQLLRHVHFPRSFTVQIILKIRQIHKSPTWSQLKFIKCKSSHKQFAGIYMTLIETI